MHVQSLRQQWLAVLSTAKREDLKRIWRERDAGHEFRCLRKTVSGLCMVRGRSDGAGRPFNLGEATISRCVVTTTDSANHTPITGVGYVLGRDRDRADLMARFDALFQDSAHGLPAVESVLSELESKQQQAAAAAARKTDSTRVEFFTMVRGE
ncbi:MAG: alpha-D-ribose 1-methylphosphonate 5-triphosphate synthase subunit PhnG [Gammaproteobacteria bacterium]|jgi:alpha-D-ribose 1-methylphosphonate 5-triphosphate synthase subunit PhnG